MVSSGNCHDDSMDCVVNLARAISFLSAFVKNKESKPFAWANSPTFPVEMSCGGHGLAIAHAAYSAVGGGIDRLSA